MAYDRETEYGRWFEKAHDDELNVASILKHQDGAPNGACFLSQQMAEKYLKGLLIFYGKLPPKVHDLVRLGALIAEFEPEIKNFESELKILSDYYIETRYPGDYPEFHWGDAEEAFQAVQKIKQFVFDRIAAGEAIKSQS